MTNDRISSCEQSEKAKKRMTSELPWGNNKFYSAFSVAWRESQDGRAHGIALCRIPSAIFCIFPPKSVRGPIAPAWSELRALAQIAPTHSSGQSYRRPFGQLKPRSLAADLRRFSLGSSSFPSPFISSPLPPSLLLFLLLFFLSLIFRGSVFAKLENVQRWR